MTHPAPLTFPVDEAGWLAFAGERSDERLARVRQIVDRLTDESPAIVSALDAWNEAQILLAEVMSEASVLSESHPSAAVRETAEERVQRSSSLATDLTLDPALWAVFRPIEGADESALDPQQARLLERIRREFRRAGVDLDPETRERVRALTERDTELGLTFSRNVRDGRREVRVAPEALAGLPQDFIDARAVADDGLVVLTTDYPDLMPVREYAHDRETRRSIVAAYNDLAYPENEAVLAELLAVRAERAGLLGYGDWADFETETRMIGSSAAIRDFLTGIDDATRDAALAEYPVLLERLQRDDPAADSVLISDFWYLLGALKNERHDVDAQRVRSYFSFDKVLQGVLDTTGRLLDVRYEPVDAGAWHADVRSYDVVRDEPEGPRHLGRIHLDLHPREGKYTHAACFPLAPGITGAILPEGVLLCNFARGLLEHDEVVTFFHEFGHLVHYVLAGDQRLVEFSGINNEWDFVEAPSQLLEEWAWDTAVLQTFATDASGEPIPADLVARMREADEFGRALEVRRQLGHANVSYHLHVDRPDDLQAATEHWYTVTSPIAPIPGSHSYAGFGHLTGYGACYYTYQWSLVIARDLLSAFGDDLMNTETAARYRTLVLEPGATKDATALVVDFLGRPYSFDAYREWVSAGD